MFFTPSFPQPRRQPHPPPLPFALQIVHFYFSLFTANAYVYFLACVRVFLWNDIWNNVWPDLRTQWNKPMYSHVNPIYVMKHDWLNANFMIFFLVVFFFVLLVITVARCFGKCSDGYEHFPPHTSSQRYNSDEYKSNENNTIRENKTTGITKHGTNTHAQTQTWKESHNFCFVFHFAFVVEKTKITRYMGGMGGREG